MSRIAIADVYEAPEVDLWGHVFVVRELTKHLEEKSTDLEREVREKIDAAENGEELVTALGRYFDVTLKRVEEDGKRSAKPSTLLKQKWNSSQLSIEQLMRFFVAVIEQSSGQVPPT